MKKEPAWQTLDSYVWELVVLFPLLDLGLGQSLDILGGVDGSLAANAVDEVQALGSLEQSFLVTSGIAERTNSVLLDQSSGLGIILLLADDLLQWNEPPFVKSFVMYVLYIFLSGNQYLNKNFNNILAKIVR